jgi:hypothetical protein
VCDAYELVKPHILRLVTIDVARFLLSLMLEDESAGCGVIRMTKIIGRTLIVLVLGWAGSVAAVPITGADAMTVDGTDWAQVDLFTNLSWNDINAYCPGGVCDTGRLNGNDMEGTDKLTYFSSKSGVFGSHCTQ